MDKFLAFLQTSTFRKNLIIAIISVIIVILLIFFSLRYYTRHGEGVPVPLLKDLTIEEAIRILEDNNLGYNIDSVYQMEKLPGTMVEQYPAPNTNVKLNRTIYLTIISRTAPDVGFPDISQKTFLEARAILSNYGLKIGDTSYISDVARNRILKVEFKSKQINTGDMIPKGSTVNLILGDGRGAGEVDLPSVIGLSLSEAVMALKGMELKPGLITYENVIDTAAARVVKQYPALSDSLTKVNIGSNVDLILSNNPPLR